MKLNLQKYGLSEEVTSGTFPIRFHSNSGRPFSVRCHMEIWKPVVGYEGLYDVSNIGRVRSYYSNRGRGYHNISCIPQRNMKNKPDNRGYWIVSLCKRGIKTRNHHIHRLVLDAFVITKPSGYQCCHKNNIKTDNRVENLCWGTPQQNSSDYGTQTFGEKNGCHKLSYDEVLAIRNMGDSNYTQREIAKLFCVAQSTICVILRHKHWNHPNLIIQGE
jgi:hypothetical protein